MKKVLIVKLSAMGDVIHTLPAITDAKTMDPNLQIDWLVDARFQEIPAWHPGVNRVIPIPLKSWRKSPWQVIRSGEFRSFCQTLRLETYDEIIDAQGLLKSAILAFLAKGHRQGYDRSSAREGVSTWLMQQTHPVDRGQHAIIRTRQLLAKSLGYGLETLPLNYGLSLQPNPSAHPAYVVLIANTSWESKLWAESHWVALGQKLEQAGYAIKLTSGNALELARAQRISAQLSQAEALSPLNLNQLAALVAQASAVVSLDTGLSHLTAALGVPNVALFGPTSAALTRPLGAHQQVLAAEMPCAPCLKRTCHHPERAKFPIAPCLWGIHPDQVFEVLKKDLA